MPETPDYIILHSPACSVVLECSSGEAPLWRYWGPRLPDGVTPGVGLRATRPEPSFSLAFDQPLSLFPGTGLGWFGQSALAAHRAGRDWAQAITRTAITRPDAASAIIAMADDIAGIAVTVALRLDPATDVLSIATQLTNTGDGVLDVAWLAAAVLPLPPSARNVLSFTGRHNAEFVPLAAPLTRATWRRENRRGITSHDSFPGAFVTAADGSAYGAQLAWSGNHTQQIEALDDGRYQWQLGEGLTPGEVRLAPGAVLCTPEVLASCAAPTPGSAEGAIDQVSQAFHRAIRARLAWPSDAMTPRPVHLNSWEACYFDHDEAMLRDLASAAAAIGVERFVLDDGWFAGRRDDTAGLGDWWPEPTLYPEGLGPLAHHVTGLGMEFGLWIEPEMVNPESQLFRAHPDWALTVPGRAPLRARHQLVLDLARPEVSDYLFAQLAALLASLPITYLKWDHNRDLTDAGATPRYRAQVLAAYALIDRIRAAFPMVEIEACAGGGGRIDAGIAARVHRFWASDCLDAGERVRIQRGFLRFLPPELMGSHVGAAPAHSTGCAQAIMFRAGVALCGHFGVELDPRQLDDADRAVLAAGIARYKRLRDRLHQGAVWQSPERHDADDGVVWQAHGQAEALLLIVTRTAPTHQRHAPRLALPMLDPLRRYRVRAEDAAPDDATTYDGAWLARVGLPLPPMLGQEVRVWELTAL